MPQSGHLIAFYLPNESRDRIDSNCIVKTTYRTATSENIKFFLREISSGTSVQRRPLKIQAAGLNLLN